MKIREIIDYINTFANEKWQYPWDNTGLQAGDLSNELTGILLCVDVLDDVVDEAVKNNCNLIISHHPLLFSGVKRIGDDYKSNIIRKLIKNDITVYSSHTAFDVCDYSMNHYIAEKLSLRAVRYLDTLSEMKCSFSAVVSESAVDDIKDILASLNAENISIVSDNTGKAVVSGSIFKAFSGKLSQKIYKKDSSAGINISDVSYTDTSTGLGLIGELPGKKSFTEVADRLKEIFGCDTLRVSRNYSDKKIRTVAICSGSGGDYLKTAMRMGADLYVCADLKWNDFLVCEESGLAAACPTHFESEKSFITIMSSKLKEFNDCINIFESVSKDVESFL